MLKIFIPLIRRRKRVMNIKKFGFFVMAVLFVSQVYAALPSLSGGSGLVISRTTDVLRRGNFNASLFLTTNIYRLPSDLAWPTRTTEFAPTMSFNYGVLDTFEVGLLLPFVVGAGFKPKEGGWDLPSEKDAGLGKIKMILKWAVFPNSVHEKPFNVGLTGYAGVPTASSKYIGSNDLNAGVELNTALFYGKKKQFGTYLNFGIENGDYFFEACPGDSDLCTYKGEKIDGVISGLKLVGSLGFDYYPVKKVGLVFEANGSSFRDTKDEDLYAVVGAKYIPLKNLAVDGGIGVGLPLIAVKTNTDFTVTLGASYLFGKGKEKPAPAAPAPKVTKPVEVAKPVPAPGAKPPEAAPAARATRIMVLNGCATGNAAEPAAALLKEKGFNVAKIAAIKEKKFNETQIRFPKEFTKDAVEISRLLPGKQQMARMTEARQDADVIVVAGCDQIVSPPAAPAAPAAPVPPVPAVQPPPPPPAPVEKKSLKEMRVTVFNACGKIGLGEEAAKKLLLEGYNITKVGTADVKGAKTSEIKYIGVYEKEADAILGKLNLKAKKSPVTTLTDAEISINLGCDYTGK
jgi:hypothetical protein